MKCKKEKKKLSICFVSPHGYALFNKKSRLPYGGGEVQFYLLSKELAGHSEFLIKVLTGDYNIKKFRIETFNKIKIFVISPQNRNIMNYFVRPILMFFTLCLIKPDVVVQRTGGISTGICAFYCNLFKKKFIYSISHENEVIKKGINGIQGKIFQYGLLNADYIVAQNYDQVKKLKRWKNELSKIKVIKSGYEIPKEKASIKNKEYIFWVGRAVPWKQPEIFLRLAQIFPEEKFVMIFRNSNLIEYWEKIRNKAKKLPNLKFYNHIPFHKIDEFFKKALVFINTSISEGFPNTFIQALKNGTPVISFNVDPDAFLYNNQCGFNCKNNIEILKKNLNLLLNQPVEYNKLSLNGYYYSKKNHDLKNISNQWAYLIKLITKKR